jgi:hypothetical protein
MGEALEDRVRSLVACFGTWKEVSVIDRDEEIEGEAERLCVCSVHKDG